MMQLSSVLLALTLWISYALCEPLSRTSIVTVNSDMTAMKGNIVSLNMLLGDFSGNIFQANSIRAICDALQQANAKTTQDIENAKPLTEEEGNTIYAAVHTLGPVLADTFSILIEKKGMFASLGVASLVRDSLHDLENGITPLVNNLVDAVPTAEQKDRTAQEGEQILAGLRNCESIYSS